MKRSFGVGTTIAMLALVLTMADGCRRRPPELPPPAAPTPEAAPVTKPDPPPPPPPPPAEKPRELTEEELFAKMTLEELNKKRPLADVFFAFDSSEINPEGRSALQKNLEFLKRWPTTEIRIEGHADSRGTNEYNLALGERRAAAVRDYLVSLGLQPNRVTIVSKGEEEPFCTEEHEACWQQNRRGHFIFTAK
jgi:peptidoglycan-associated lipoprotein